MSDNKIASPQNSERRGGVTSTFFFYATPKPLFFNRDVTIREYFSSAAVGKYFSQHIRHLPRSCVRQDAQPLDQARLVHGPDLVEDHLPLLPLKGDIYATGVVSLRQYHGRY